MLKRTFLETPQLHNSRMQIVLALSKDINLHSSPSFGYYPSSLHSPQLHLMINIVIWKDISDCFFNRFIIRSRESNMVMNFRCLHLVLLGTLTKTVKAIWPKHTASFTASKTSNNLLLRPSKILNEWTLKYRVHLIVITYWSLKGGFPVVSFKFFKGPAILYFKCS